MKKLLLLAATVAMTASSAAFAADAVDQIPMAPVADVAPAFTWSGPYLGIQGGGGWANGDFGFGGGSVSEDFDGGILGAFVGYNWQLSNGFVLGLEGDVDYNWNEETVGGADVGTDWAGSVRGRVGYAFDRALVYGAAGWTATNGYVDGGGADDNETFHGWTVGAGVDYAFTDNMFGRVEYRYNDFSDKDLAGVNVDFDQHVVKVGLGVKF